jgi:peptidoglycan/LPS O-acetylase OafA/YrhL
MARNRFDALDGMRGVCAVFVAIYHFDTVLKTGHLLNHGWLSVDVFFVLSGFVIALVYEDRLRSGSCFFAFLRARARRLLPIQVLGTVIVAASLLALYESGDLHLSDSNFAIWAVTLLYGILLIPNFLSPVAHVFAFWPAAFPANPPLWSLQGEWIVNILYGLWLHAARSSVLILVCLTLASYLTFYAFHHPHGWDATVPFDFTASTARAGMGFLIGVLVHRAHRKDILQGLPSVRPELVYSLWFLVCAIPTPHALPLFESTTAIVFAPLAVALLVRSDKAVPKIFLVLGTLSYPLYASHFAIVNLMPILMEPAGHSYSWLLAFPMLAAALTSAWALNLLIETTMPRALRRRAADRPAARSRRAGSRR